MHRYNGSEVMFRRARACSLDAHQQAQLVAAERGNGLNGIEPAQREKDAVIETIILAQAAAESYVNWIFIQADVKPVSSSWLGRWGGLHRVGEALGRTVEYLPSEHNRFFKELNAWRNYLVHGDEKAYNVLRSALMMSGNGEPGDARDVIDRLDSGLASAVIQRARSAFTWAAGQTGINAPSASWLSPTELSSEPVARDGRRAQMSRS
jgi:hypothetical protein